MVSKKMLVSTVLMLTAPVATSCLAADGDLDPDFGTGGIAYLTPDLVGAQELTPYKAMVLPDGKILFAGSLDKPTGVPFEQEYRGMLTRFNADGSVDGSFGNTTIPGVVEIPALDVVDLLERHLVGLEQLGFGGGALAREARGRREQDHEPRCVGAGEVLTADQLRHGPRRAPLGLGPRPLLQVPGHRTGDRAHDHQDGQLRHGTSLAS